MAFTEANLLGLGNLAGSLVGTVKKAYGTAVAPAANKLTNPVLNGLKVAGVGPLVKIIRNGAETTATRTLGTLKRIFKNKNKKVKRPFQAVRNQRKRLIG